MGKSTLAEQLATRGYLVVPEAARRLIRSEQNRQARARRRGERYPALLPDEDLLGFQSRLLEVHHSAEQHATDEAIRSGRDLVFDRTAADGLAFLMEAGISPREHYSLYKMHIDLLREGRYDAVMLLEPLSTYVNDGQRKESQQQARRLHERLRTIYTHLGRRFGFDVISVPALPVEERLDYVLDRIDPRRGGKPRRDERSAAP